MSVVYEFKFLIVRHLTGRFSWLLLRRCVDNNRQKVVARSERTYRTSGKARNAAEAMRRDFTNVVIEDELQPFPLPNTEFSFVSGVTSLIVEIPRRLDVRSGRPVLSFSIPAQATAPPAPPPQAPPPPPAVAAAAPTKAVPTKAVPTKAVATRTPATKTAVKKAPAKRTSGRRGSAT